MKPWHKRVGKSLSPKPLLSKVFNAIEQSAPLISSAIRYHSHAEEFTARDYSETLYRPIRVAEPAYRDAYAALIARSPQTVVQNFYNEKIPIHTALVESCVIHGHIKAPIIPKRRAAIGFEFPHGRLPWGDVYPQPFHRTRRLAGDAIFIPKFNNIFHLLVEYILPAFAAVLRHPDSFQRKIYFVSQTTYPIINFLVQFMNHIGLRAEAIYISAFDRIEPDRLIAARAKANDSAFNYAYFEEMQQSFKFFDRLVADIAVPEKVFITRSNTPRRNILNQSEIITRINKNNFEAVDFNFDNCLLQIAIFRKSKYIISAHGAALTNIAFSSPGQNILELFSQKTKPTCFVNMASQHQLNYHYLLGSEEAGNGHFHVEPDILLKFAKDIWS